MMSRKPFVNNSKICAKIIGGMGNQMFIAAAAIALAKRHDCALAFDLGSYKKYDIHDYALEPFDLDAKILPETAPSKSQTYLMKLSTRLRGQKGKQVHGCEVWEQPGYHYFSEFEHLGVNTYLSGYFQSPKYFAGYEATIKNIFNLEKGMTECGMRMAETALSAGQNAIGIHLRRGDYVTNPRALAHHGLMDEAYYKRALKLLDPLVKEPELFVISDDRDATRQMFSEFGDIMIADGTNEFDDMNLLARCHHKIIANSSFSWWGAWLGHNGQGLTLCPRHWFSIDIMRKTSVIDLIPENWVIV